VRGSILKGKQVKHMWGLIIGTCIVLVVIGLRVDGKIDNKFGIALLSVAIIAGITIAYFGSTKKVEYGPFALETFREDVNAVKEDALKEIREDLAIQKEALSGVIDKANKTREDLLKVAEATAPPHLSLESKPEIKQIDGGYEVKLQLNPSKNAPFAMVQFRAEIVEDSEATIQEFGRFGGMVFNFSKKTSDNGKIAMQKYKPSGDQQQGLLLKVSEPCKVRISCSHMLNDLVLTVK